MSQTGCIGASGASLAAGALPLGLAPIALAAACPASCASATTRARSLAPLAAPAGITNPSPVAPLGGLAGSGRKWACASSQMSLPPQCDHRCTTGDQPPDIAPASQAISSSAAPSPACAQIETPVTRLPPC